MCPNTCPTGMKMAPGAVSGGHFRWWRGQDSNLRPPDCLTGDRVMPIQVSQTCRPPLVLRPCHHAPFRVPYGQLRRVLFTNPFTSRDASMHSDRPSPRRVMRCGRSDSKSLTF